MTIYITLTYSNDIAVVVSIAPAPPQTDSPSTRRERIESDRVSRTTTVTALPGVSQQPTRASSMEGDCEQEIGAVAPDLAHATQPSTAATLLPMTAVNAVFSTTEMLEHILTLVNAKTALVSQRVSRHWQQVVIGSPPLQKKLYLQPVATFEEALRLTQAEDDGQLVVFHAKVGNARVHGLLNPLLFDLAHTKGLGTRPHVIAVHDFSPRSRSHQQQQTTVVPSFQPMLLCQPPLRFSSNAQIGKTPHDQTGIIFKMPAGTRLRQWQARARALFAARTEMPLAELGAVEPSLIVVIGLLGPLGGYREHGEWVEEGKEEEEEEDEEDEEGAEREGRATDP
ncbi:hypothetical protein LTR53_013430 [Teratosphaeriaceae sp. CCFEE 6253]|nr:hypothetical protein LTR53_013430 [Teratosphaeriaceae sp. CCFEE 6253]